MWNLKASMSSHNCNVMCSELQFTTTAPSTPTPLGKHWDEKSNWWSWTTFLTLRDTMTLVCWFLFNRVHCQYHREIKTQQKLGVIQNLALCHHCVVCVFNLQCALSSKVMPYNKNRKGCSSDASCGVKQKDNTVSEEQNSQPWIQQRVLGSELVTWYNHNWWELWVGIRITCGGQGTQSLPFETLLSQN